MFVVCMYLPFFWYLDRKSLNIFNGKTNFQFSQVEKLYYETLIEHHKKRSCVRCLKSGPLWRSLSFACNRRFSQITAQLWEASQCKLDKCPCDPKKRNLLSHKLWINSWSTHDGICVCRPRNRNSKSQKKYSKRHVHVAAVSCKVNANRRNLPTVRAAGQRVCQCIELVTRDKQWHARFESISHKSYQERIVAMTASNSAHSRHSRNRRRNRRRCKVNNTFAVRSWTRDSLRRAFTD